LQSALPTENRSDAYNGICHLGFAATVAVDAAASAAIETDSYITMHSAQGHVTVKNCA